MAYHDGYGQGIKLSRPLSFSRYKKKGTQQGFPYLIFVYKHLINNYMQEKERRGKERKEKEESKGVDMNLYICEQFMDSTPKSRQLYLKPMRIGYIYIVLH